MVPPSESKHFWKNYIYIWIKYALFEEQKMHDKQKAAEIFHALLKLIPHKKFSFAKIWILAAQLQIRRKDMTGARQILGRALGLCPKRKIFHRYVEIEFFLGNIDRCRMILEKFITSEPESVEAWVKYAELEATVQEDERAKTIYEIALSQPTLDVPELLWKSYIEYECKRMKRANVRKLYERILKKTQHIKVWLSYADFEARPLTIRVKNDQIEREERPEFREPKAREIYHRAYLNLIKQPTEYKEEIIVILKTWKTFEEGCVAETEAERAHRVDNVIKKMPVKLNRKNILHQSNESTTHLKEHWDYICPENKKTLGLKLLTAAHAWKKSTKLTTNIQYQ
eukprot:gnl/TRDRNA2_/TRDRNA2_177741_c2_seq3.p1 gnl/TRDRNA2_/TRDRNA2_177741_c2~~gnl/TRDRNA2_/TRDRNA2_177741_c2_seq3.p1  ORF type:complete len:341 (-),score=-7.02 gnl/TRDRNA2_/TRDRNA2_177741_c2_seq3:125-1147(-)